MAKIVIMECLCCGKEFIRKKNAQKHCSAGCRRKWNSGKEAKAKYYPKTFTCSWCGIIFEAEQKRKYCSDECRFASYGRRKIKGSNAEKIAKINQLARDEGLSYGQVVAKYGL